MGYRDPEKQREASRRHYAKNREVMLERAKVYNKANQERLRARIREAKDQPCADCGQRYPYYVMDFDHVRGVKKFNVGQGSWRKSMRVLNEEIAKCDVVCSNCHRERTWGDGRLASDHARV